MAELSTLGGVIKSAYEGEPNTNALTDADKVKLAAFNLNLFIETVVDQDYVLSYDAPFAGTITMLRTKTQSGTCTVTGKINSIALGGTENSATSTPQEQAHASANVFAKGDTIKVTVSANSAALLLEIHFLGTES